MNMQDKKAVVLVSGGMDSALTLAIAKAQGFQCYALSIDYFQRHRAELHAAAANAQSLGAVQHKVVQVDLRSLGGSALTQDDIAVPVEASTGIPSTYVPARNTIMLSVALGWAEVLGARDLFTGVNAVDFSGYPDCRPAFVAAYELLANVATKAGVEAANADQRIRVHAPLIEMSKADIVRKGVAMGIDFSRTVSCYQADANGLACGVCDACRLRAAGFAQAGVVDVTRYR
jgi:7-cyano-7-deazaguanine synthase